jgi:transcriptional regulator with PAS, ATPase and Fis domain
MKKELLPVQPGARSGYFEVADGGTIFLDEVGELPLTTQVRLLRVLENGEFIKVGSSTVQKTNVRIVAATNLNMHEAVKKGKFREDLYYRLSTIEIHLPPLRERKDDIHLLFRKFAADFAQKYKMPSIRLTDEAVFILENFNFPGNIRQLRNIAEQISVVEENRTISAEKLQLYLPKTPQNLPMIVGGFKSESDFSNEREIMYKILFDMKNDINDLKKVTYDMLHNGNTAKVHEENKHIIQKILKDKSPSESNTTVEVVEYQDNSYQEDEDYNYDDESSVEIETASLHDIELEMIKKSLERHQGKRKLAAKELGISERTLYRKIKQYNL